MSTQFPLSTEVKEALMLTAETSSYDFQEVNQIYEHMMYHFHQMLLKHGKLQLLGFCTIAIRESYEKSFMSALYNKPVTARTRPGVSAKAHTLLRNSLVQREIDKYQAEKTIFEEDYYNIEDDKQIM